MVRIRVGDKIMTISSSSESSSSPPRAMTPPRELGPIKQFTAPNAASTATAPVKPSGNAKKVATPVANIRADASKKPRKSVKTAKSNGTKAISSSPTQLSATPPTATPSTGPIKLEDIDDTTITVPSIKSTKHAVTGKASVSTSSVKTSKPAAAGEANVSASSVKTSKPAAAETSKTSKRARVGEAAAATPSASYMKPPATTKASTVAPSSRSTKSAFSGEAAIAPPSVDNINASSTGKAAVSTPSAKVQEATRATKPPEAGMHMAPVTTPSAQSTKPADTIKAALSGNALSAPISNDQTGASNLKRKRASNENNRPVEETEKRQFKMTRFTTYCRSRLVSYDVYHYLTREDSWTDLSADYKLYLLKMLPRTPVNCGLIAFATEAVRRGDGTAQIPRPKELKACDILRTDVAKFKQDLENGHLAAGWQKGAARNMIRRDRGDFDEWKEQEMEFWWGQKTKSKK